MGKRYIGKIEFVRKNYGLVSTTIEDHNVKLYFITKPDMFDEKQCFVFGKYISFETRNLTIRDTNVVCAYNLKPNNEKPKKIKIEKDSLSDSNYDGVVSKELLKDLSVAGALSKKDNEANLFFFKWILYLEQETKDLICEMLNKASIDSSSFIDALKNNNKTSKIIKDVLNKLREDTLFRTESDSLKYIIKDNDPNDVVIVDAPVRLMLEQLTIKDISLVFNISYDKCKNKLDEDLDAMCFYFSNMLDDVVFIRNKVAHGKTVIPLILDDVFSPSYLYEMASIYPKWNSCEKTNDVEKYPAFEFIRYQTRSLAKAGINLAGIDGGPLQIALFFTKSLLINQAKRSFFSLMFLLMCVFSYWNDSKYNNFIKEIEAIGIICFERDHESVFSKLPSEDNSIRTQLSRLVAPIFAYADGPITFKLFSSISLKIFRKQN